MNGFWKRKLPALLLAMILAAGLVTPALADGIWGYDATSHWQVDDSGNRVDQSTEAHVLGDPVVTKTATCYQEGESTQTCTICGYQTRSSIAKTPHQYDRDHWASDNTQHFHACKNAPDCNSKIDEENHVWKSAVTTNATCTVEGKVEQTCSVCNKTVVVSTLPALGHTAPNAQGRCDRCNALIATPPSNSITVTFKNGATTFNSQTITSGTKPSNPGNPSYPTSTAGCGYAFKHWTTTSPTTGNKAIYTNEPAASITSTLSQNTTYYAVYTLSASSQNFTVSAGTTTGKTVGGEILSQINGKFSSLTGRNTFASVKFSSPKSNSYGVLYANSSQGGISYNSAYNASNISSFYFVPGSSSGYTVNYSATDNYGSTIAGTITISATASATASSIPYYVEPGGTVDLKTSDFVNAFNKASGGVNGTLRYVTFTAPSGYSNFDGSLYTGSLALTQSRLNNNTFYYGSYSGDYALNTVNFKADKSARNGDTLSIPFQLCTNGVSYPGTLKIIVSENGSDGVITYRVAPGKTINFDRTHFNNAYQELSGNSNRDIRYVYFDAGRDYTSFSGKISARGHSNFDRNDLSLDGEQFYYSSSSYGDYALDDLSFTANSGARDGDSLSISFRAYYDKDRWESGTLKIVIDKNGSEDTVEIEAAPGSTVRLDRADFNDVYRTLSDSKKTLDYIAFEAPSNYNDFAGQLYAGSTALTRTDLRYNGTWFYYDSSDAGSRDYALNDLSFKADSNAKNNSTITIPFRAYYGKDDPVEGFLKISINSSKGDQVSYSVAAGGTVSLKPADFNDAYRNMSGNSSRTISYVAFDAPNAYANFAGQLYTNSTALTRTDLTYSKTQFYYSSSRYGNYALDTLNFRAAGNAKNGDSISIPFRAYYSDNNGDYEEGTLKITIGTGLEGDVNYTVAPGKTVNFDRTHFQDYLRKTYSGETLSYVVFDEPRSTEYSDNDGTFYSGYGTSYATFFRRSTLADTRFYYNSADAGDRDYVLNDLSFAAASSFNGKVTLRFTAYGGGSRSVEGTVVIQPTSANSSNIVGSIIYASTTGNNIQINAHDLEKFYKASNPADTLQYVVLNDVPNVGGLYYNYYTSSAYGSAVREQITAANRSQRSFYMSPTSTSQYALTELTYVPSGSNYCTSVPFTAYGTGGRSLTGSILISISTSTVSEIYGVTPKNTTVNFPAAAIYSAVTTATGSAPNGIQLLKLPASNVGTVYAGTGSTAANTSTVYPYSGGTQQMGQLRFTPAANYTGSVEIPYVALNANGVPMATGTFSLGVLNANRQFTDVSATTWCYKYVMELADSGVIGGYSNGSFKPNSTITYGAALKLVMLAAGYPEQAPTVKGSTFSGYLARAQADGLITRSNVNLSASITRLQVAQLAAGALKLDINNLSGKKPFTDTNDVYVQALNAAGIVGGYFSNGVSTYRPGNTLTRGQVAAIVWRMQNYVKQRG